MLKAIIIKRAPQEATWGEVTKLSLGQSLGNAPRGYFFFNALISTAIAVISLANADIAITIIPPPAISWYVTSYRPQNECLLS